MREQRTKAQVKKKQTNKQKKTNKLQDNTHPSPLPYTLL